MGEVILLGILLGAGAAISVGPIFVTIVQEAATRGFGSGCRVIVGSTVADLVLILPALAFSWVIARVAAASLWVGLIGSAFLLYLCWDAATIARRLWAGEPPPPARSGWSFWKGAIGNLTNPLAWTFWLATGTPTMLRSYRVAGLAGLVVFTLTWFSVAVVVEAILAGVVARTGRAVGAKGMAVFNGLAAATFLTLAVVTLTRSLWQ